LPPLLTLAAAPASAASASSRGASTVLPAGGRSGFCGSGLGGGEGVGLGSSCLGLITVAPEGAAISGCGTGMLTTVGVVRGTGFPCATASAAAISAAPVG
jgi:hypothetical protein